MLESKCPLMFNPIRGINEAGHSTGGFSNPCLGSECAWWVEPSNYLKASTQTKTEGRCAILLLAQNVIPMEWPK